MMMKRILSLLAIVAAAGTAGARDMNVTLGKDGTLCRVERGADGLILTVRPSAGGGALTDVPQTADPAIRNIQVGYATESGTVVLVWERDINSEQAIIQLATWREGTWFGPITIAGDDGIRTANPAMLLQHVLTEPQTEGEERLETTFIHLAWWRDEDSEDGGWAMYAAIPLGDDGTPRLDRMQEMALHQLIPYGIGCDLTATQRQALVHPAFTVDPETGAPLLFFVDVDDCLFEILQLAVQVEEGDGDGDTFTSQRRRHVVVFGVRKDIALPPILDLTGAQFEVGHGMTVVGYWDTAEGINYIRMDDTGWSDTKTLQVGNGLTHEQAVELVRNLARQ